MNEFPDFLADCAAGKSNLVARMGRERASRVLPWIYVAAFGCWRAPGVPVARAAALGLARLCGPAHGGVGQRAGLGRAETFFRHRPAQPAALLTFVLYALGVAAGLALG